MRESGQDAKPMNAQNEPMDGIQYFYIFYLKGYLIKIVYFTAVDDENVKVFTLEPMTSSVLNSHDTTFINELKLSEFKQVLNKSNITSEFVGGVLWCCNGTLAVRRVSTNYYFIYFSSTINILSILVRSGKSYFGRLLIRGVL